jgi:GTP cyclohydrolase IA
MVDANAYVARHEVQSYIADRWTEILDSLGFEPTDGMRDTPVRAAKALMEMISGYQVDVPALFTTFETNGYDEMIVLRGIEFSSLCEHHVLPFTGVAHIAYIPDGRVIGLSKLARVVEAYARRLQIQERLTEEVADALQDNLQPKGVAVVVEATHTCMALRGVRKPGAVMVTSAIRGVVWKPEVRAEAMTLMGVA